MIIVDYTFKKQKKDLSPLPRYTGSAIVFRSSFITV